jgi:hypothetical protein
MRRLALCICMVFWAQSSSDHSRMLVYMEIAIRMLPEICWFVRVG